MGWAAVDALARRYVKEGVCERLEQARGKALIDLVTGNASIEVTVVLTTLKTPTPTPRTPRPDARPRGPGPEPGPEDTTDADRRRPAGPRPEGSDAPDDRRADADR